MLFVFSCKNQTNNQTNKPNIPPDIPPKQNEIVITVSGDSNVKIAQSPSFNVLKNSTWADVKVKANQKISFSDGFVLKSWRLANKYGKLLLDTEMFTENTTVFAVSQTDIPQQDEIVITVSGDTNVKIAQSPSFNVLKNSTWASVKVKADQKISFSDGFVLKSWHLTNKDGKLLVDTEVFTENTTVFAVSQKENIPEESEKPVKDEDGNEIKEEIIGEEGKDKEVKAIIEVVEVKEEGKEKPTTKLKISGNILSDETKRIADILRSKIYEYKNKKDELKNIQFDSVASNSTLNIQFKDESKKINVEDLKILVAKIPNQVKIDNEDCITLDKSANITSIKGTVSLMDIVKGANSSSELTKWEFISDKIKEQSSINSDNLAITSKEGEKFNTENLKKVANILSKTEIKNTTTNGNQTITLGKDAKISSINGNIALKDIVDAKNETDTELANYIAYNLKNNPSIESPSGILKINTFYKKPSTIQGSSLSLRGNNNEEPKSTPITPSVLSDIKNSALNKAILNFKDGDKNIPVSFKSKQGQTEEEKQKDYFDITDFYNEITNGKLKEIQNNVSNDSMIFLRGEREKVMDGENDNTNYPKADEIVELFKKFGSSITVGSVYISGTLNGLLPNLAEGKIKETEEGIKIVDYYFTKCYETGFKNGNLKPKELQEYHNRARYNLMRIMNSTIVDLNSENYKGDFIGDMLTNVTFKGGDLSEINFSCQTSNGFLKFENLTLPKNMEKSAIEELRIKNSKLPKDLKNLPGFTDGLTSLKIYNENKNDFFSLFKGTLEEIDGHSPIKYVGPKDIWDKLKVAYPNNNKTHFTDEDKTDINIDDIQFTSLNKKPQSPVLLALLQGKTDHTRG